MKPSAITIEALADIGTVKTTGDVRRVGSQMLLALARKEVPASDVEAASKMIEAISNSINAEVRLAVAAIALRDKGAQLAKVEHLGKTVIGDDPAAAIAS